MIKKFILLFWFEKKDKTQEHRTFRKSYARFSKHGYKGMKSRLDKEYDDLKKDIVANSQLERRYSTMKTRLFFTILFITALTYTMFLKTELYESKTALMVRDLSSSSPAASLGLGLLGVGSSSQLQDSMIVQEYLTSLDMFLHLDKEFSLIKHYKSEKLDFLERLSEDATMEESLEFYQKRLVINYDEISAILHISYIHTNPETAKKILEFMIESVSNELNEFNRRKAKKQLKFIEMEYAKNKQKMDKSSALLEKYQNDQLLLDPATEATSSSSIMANLEATLIQKSIEYKTKSSYLNADNYELVTLKDEIKEIKNSLAKIKKNLSGTGKDRLNKILFEYERLKMQLEFDKEIYKNALLQLETIKLDVLKEAKTLSIVSKPNLPDGYTYPNKPKIFITLVIAILLIYGIFSMLIAIIRDHKE
ncbi:MAG: hypothetical protein DRG78_11395 [Epsilonproteobacteria bacterium]|nr:MAG: hypothetical protein DRG78_11395 [Campylobacterota bacterium]